MSDGHRRLTPSAMALVLLLFSSCSCSPDQRYRKPTIPVTGEVYVDGKPAATLEVKLHNVDGYDDEHPTASTAFTDDAGKFEVSTYDEGDGVPVGEYVLTFEWGELNTFSMQYEGDKLKGKYKDPRKSEVRVKVEEGQPKDMGRIELSTG